MSFKSFLVGLRSGLVLFQAFALAMAVPYRVSATESRRLTDQEVLERALKLGDGKVNEFLAKNSGNPPKRVFEIRRSEDARKQLLANLQKNNSAEMNKLRALLEAVTTEAQAPCVGDCAAPMVAQDDPRGRSNVPEGGLRPASGRAEEADEEPEGEKPPPTKAPKPADEDDEVARDDEGDRVRPHRPQSHSKHNWKDIGMGALVGGVLGFALGQAFKRDRHPGPVFYPRPPFGQPPGMLPPHTMPFPGPRPVSPWPGMGAPGMIGQPGGMFGQPGGMFGQPGGMFGQPGGMFGQPGGMFGQPGGMFGQPGGMFGQPGGMFGQPGMGFNNPQLGYMNPGGYGAYNPYQSQIAPYIYNGNNMGSVMPNYGLNYGGTGYPPGNYLTGYMPPPPVLPFPGPRFG
jgi:hypothetical protein